MDSGWPQIAIDAVTGFWLQVAAYAPRVLGAAALFLIGWLIAWLLARGLRALLLHLKFDALSERLGVAATLKASHIERTPTEVAGSLVFWVIFLLFVISVSSTLGLARLSETIQSVVLLVPKVLFAIVIFVAGVALARFIGRIAGNALENIGFGPAQSVATLLQGFGYLLAGIIALGQLNVQTEFIYYVLLVMLVAVGIAMAITVGLGTRQFSRQVVAGVYARDLYAAGQSLEVDGRRGQLQSIGATMAVLECADGSRIMVPNHRLLDRYVSIAGGPPAADEK